MTLKTSKKATVAFLALTALVSLYFFFPWVFDGDDWRRTLLKKTGCATKQQLRKGERPKGLFQGKREKEREREIGREGDQVERERKREEESAIPKN